MSDKIRLRAAAKQDHTKIPVVDDTKDKDDLKARLADLEKRLKAIEDKN